MPTKIADEYKAIRERLEEIEREKTGDNYKAMRDALREGLKEIAPPPFDVSSPGKKLAMPCNICRGTGRINSAIPGGKSKTCGVCGGSGRI